MPREYKKFGNWLDYNAAPLERISLHNVEEKLEQQRTKIAAQRLVTLMGLMEHYSITPDDDAMWEKLSMSLAMDFVPAMQFSKKPGVSKDWDWLALSLLVYAVDRRRERMKLEKENQKVPG